MISAQSLREQLERQSSGDLSLAAFEDWLVSASWNMRRLSPPGIQRIVEAIHVALIGNTDGAVSDADLAAVLREKLAQLQRAEHAPSDVVGKPSSVTAGEVATVIERKPKVFTEFVVGAPVR